MAAGYRKLCGIVVVVMYLMTACMSSNNSFLEKLELPSFGEGSEGDVLEVPPNLVELEIQNDYILPGSSMSMRSVTMDSLVLPVRLDMRLYRKGNTAWLLVGLSPADAWEYIRAFFESYGFSIIRQNPVAGMMETNWLERVIEPFEGVRIRDQFRVRLERSSDALTNIYVINRRNKHHNGEWSLSFSDIETELDVLYDLRDYFVQLQESENLDASFESEDLTYTIDIVNMKGVPVLTIEGDYSEVWRSFGVALERSGLEIHDSDRSRGIYLVRYGDIVPATDTADHDRLMELHLLDQDNKTFITAHSANTGAKPLAYATAHQLLKQIVWVY